MTGRQPRCKTNLVDPLPKPRMAGAGKSTVRV